MAAVPTLIFCADGNKRFASIAIEAGYKYGARLPATVYFPPYFADQDFHKPNRAAYMKALEKHRPVMATVVDWESEEQLPEVLSWAEEASQYCERLLIVPKVLSAIHLIPRTVGGKDVVLAYSVPTAYGGTSVPVWEFAGWSIHLLGGSPQAQMQAYYHLHAVADVVSADSNYAHKMATRYCQYWVPGTASYARNRWWPSLKEAHGERWEGDAPYEAFRRSCENIVSGWQRQLCPLVA